MGFCVAFFLTGTYYAFTAVDGLLPLPRNHRGIKPYPFCCVFQVETQIVFLVFHSGSRSTKSMNKFSFRFSSFLAGIFWLIADFDF
jgi:hypothetical protein